MTNDTIVMDTHVNIDENTIYPPMVNRNANVSTDTQNNPVSDNIITNTEYNPISPTSELPTVTDKVAIDNRNSSQKSRVQSKEFTEYQKMYQQCIEARILIGDACCACTHDNTYDYTIEDKIVSRIY
ncbi:hypothetical protein DOLIC_00092 [Dolichomitus sp. PSUC_FEM 10030005]|nr:hypothetical protein [Dolichomitus sp. PSUC_FEM 10030005]